MAERTLADNVAQVKADFKSIKDMARNTVGVNLDGIPTADYAAQMETGITNRYDNHYNQGIEQGRQDVISKSKYIEKTASGNVIRLDDVSEVYHNVKVKADTPTEIKVYGKNLFNNDTSLLKKVTFTGSSGTQSTRVGYEIELPKGIYTFSVDKLNQSYDHYVYGIISDKNGGFVSGFHLTEGVKLITPVTISLNDGDKVYVYNVVGEDTTATISLFKKLQIQLEVGFNATEYEPYKCQTITATPSGTEIPSNCPAMTFLADSDVTVDYYGSYGRAEAELAMWTGFTNNGARKNYSYAFCSTDFAGRRIPTGLCKPQSSLVSTFYSYSGTEIPKGVDCSEFDTTTAKNSQCYNTFAYSRKLKKIYDIGIPAGMYYYSTYYFCDLLEEIEIIRSNENTTFENNIFGSCNSLKHIIFSGTIASSINLQWSTKLDMESLLSLVNCLKRYERGTEGYRTKTITLSTESWALLDAYAYENFPEWSGATDWISGWYGWNCA